MVSTTRVCQTKLRRRVYRSAVLSHERAVREQQADVRAEMTNLQVRSCDGRWDYVQFEGSHICQS